ncbi:caspase family protein, partial [Candidatus Woesearchaeota archaeon]|nr:caspase family protein [Candidatus Woesearchaeota archaeon]
MAGRRYALVIGNSDYKDNRLSQLTAPTEDASTLADILEDPTIGNFEVTCLINESVDRIRKEIADFFARKERDDTLLMYFSGHGLLDHRRARLYLTATDTDTDFFRAT